MIRKIRLVPNTNNVKLVPGKFVSLEKLKLGEQAAKAKMQQQAAKPANPKSKPKPKRKGKK